MNATQQFIEDAIKGGWNSFGYGKAVAVRYKNGDPTSAVVTFEIHPHPADRYEATVPFSTILLDPLAWQAVGKTRFWEQTYHTVSGVDRTIGQSDYRTNWHTFIDHLADGLSIEEALTKIQ